MNYYVYLYLNPLKKGKFKTSNGVFEYEPIYVGKGRNNRIYHHVSKKSLAINNHRYNLLAKIIKTIGIDEYKSNYILKIKDNLTEDDSLLLEYNIMYELGTYYDIHPLIKRGPLLNFTLCGVKNPIMYGKNNPMYNKSFYDVWKEKYPEKVFHRMVKDHTQILSNNTSHYWDTLKHNENSYSKVCNNIKIGVNQYWDSLSDEEYDYVITKRSNNFKKFYKEHGNFKNYFIKKYGEDIGLTMESKRRDSIKNSLLNYWKTIDKESYELHSKKTKEGLSKFFKKYQSLDNYLIIKLGESEFKKRKKKISETLSKVHKERWKNMSECEILEHSNKLKEFWNSKTDEEKTEWSLKYTGKNNPMYGNGGIVKGKKNGRATQWVIHTPNGEKYYCDGNFKKFCSNILCKYKPQPHRKYLNEIIKNDSPINGWYFKKVDRTFNTKKYIIYE